MALVNNTTDLGFRYIQTTTWTAADTVAKKQELLNHIGEVIFIEATNQLYVPTGENEGTYFGLTDTQKANLTAAYNQVITGGAGTIKNKVEALEEKVGTTTKLSQTLLAIANDLKSKLDGGSYSGEGTAGTAITVTKTIDGNTTACTNVVEAVNELFSKINATVSGVSSVNGKDGAVTLTGEDIAVSSTNSDKIDDALDKKVDISTDTTVGTNSGKKASDYTNTKVIGDAIEAAHAAAAAADTAAGNKIAKSPTDTTTKTISGVTGSALVDAATIATAIETACERLLKDSTNQAQTNWGSSEKKTLTTLRDLIKDLRDDVDGITGTDLITIQNAITAIKNELGGEEGGSPRNLIGSFLDAVATILPTKNNDNTYTFTIGSGNTATSATTVQGVIDDLVGRITAAAAAAGVTKITQGTGITVNNNGVGNVTVNANSDATLTAALTTVANGATAAQGATVQSALNAINAKAAQGIGDAAAANTAAGNAQTDATAALNKLKWQVA